MRGSPFSFSDLARGLNAIDSPYTLQDGEARDCLNVVSSPRGAIKKRYGSSTFASGASAYFPLLEPTTDTFTRANESPLKKDGKGNETAWKAIEAKGVGEILANQWAFSVSAAAEGAYYSVAEQTNPAAYIEISQIVETWTGSLQILVCVDATAKKWYAGSIFRNAAGEWIVTIIKKTGAAEETVLLTTFLALIVAKDRIGLSLRGKQLTVWHYINASSMWVNMGTVEDSTYTKGFSGFLARETGGAVALGKFSTGEAPAPPAEEEFTSLLPCKTAGGNFLIAASGTKLFSITETGEITEIGSGFTSGKRWSIVQAAIGTRVTKGPVYLSNGTDAPQSWTGAAKNTATTAWTTNPKANEFADINLFRPKYLVYLANRVWAAGLLNNTEAGTLDASAVRFSGFAVVAGEGEKADPTSWPTENVVWFEKDDSEPITGIGIAGAYLMVFKPHKTWAVYDLNEGENRRLSDSVGCVSFRSIVETPQGTFFLTPDQGVFLTNGTSLREVSRNVRPILQGIDPNKARAAKADQLENAAAEFLNGHYYLSYQAQDETYKTLDYDTVLQSWWLHDIAGNQLVRWEPTVGKPFIYMAPHKSKSGIIKAFDPTTYQDSGVNYTGKSFTAEEEAGKSITFAEGPLKGTATSYFQAVSTSYALTMKQTIAGEQKFLGSTFKKFDLIQTKAEAGKKVKLAISESTPVLSVINALGSKGNSIETTSGFNAEQETTVPADGVLYWAIYGETGASEEGIKYKLKVTGADAYVVKLTAYWFSPWDPFWQYFMRHRFAQPNPKKRIRELFVDGKGEVISVIFKKFEGTAAVLKGTVDNADMASPESPVKLGTTSLEYQAARYWSLGVSRVWSFGYGNNSSEPFEIDAFSVQAYFRKS